MANTNSEELKSVFTDVRKAYRLLYHYQRRVRDTVKYISNLLPINLESIHPIYCDNTPRERARPDLDRWAWDWLNMYHYEWFARPIDEDQDKYYFAIQIQSDTGCYDTGADKTATENFSSPEEASTRLIFLYTKNRWKGEKHNRNLGFADFDTLPGLRANQPTFIEKHNEGAQIFAMMAIPLENLIGETTIKTEIDKFLQFLKTNNLKWAYGGQRI